MERQLLQLAEEQIDNEEIIVIYRKIADELEEKLGFQKFNEIDKLIMDCIAAERIKAFKGGFNQATAIWKECC